MRDIKLRGWNKKHKYMEYWDVLNDFDDHLYYVVNDCKPNIMQYTGLKDKNGVEIYEGDVVCIIKSNPIYSERHIVEINLVDGLPFCEIDKILIIGNIYENPELLEES